MNKIPMLVLLSLTGIFAAGCGTARVTGQVKSQISQIQNKAAVAQAKAQANPIAHPITATATIVKSLRAPLIVINIVGVLILAISIGLLFTPLSDICKVAVPVSGAVVVTSLTGLIALPFFPWILLGIVLLGAGLFIYEIVRTKSVTGAIDALEEDLKPVMGDQPAGEASSLESVVAAETLAAAKAAAKTL